MRADFVTSAVMVETDAVLGQLGRVESRLREVSAAAPSPVGEVASHLVMAGGKRVRPRILLHAARVAGNASDVVVDLAVAGELVHNASLLHDDVIDEADLRRGRPAARALWGNAHSVLAGDHLMAGAFELLHTAGVPGTLMSMIQTLRKLVAAEAVQLDHRGKLLPDLESYYQVVRGKTAVLFTWCADVGARAGGANDELCRALSSYGEEVGVAFQLCDDLLDLAGTSDELGKSLLADLQQGVATLPVVLAAQQRPELAALIVEQGSQASLSEGADLAAIAPDVRRWVEETGALDETRRLALGHVARARSALDALGTHPVRAVLDGLALRMVDRRS